MAFTVGTQAPVRPRFDLEENAGGIRLRIPPRKRWFPVIVSLCGLAIWVCAGGAAVGTFLGDDGRDLRFAALPLIGWALVALVLLRFVLWQLKGAVVLEVREGALKQRYTLGPLSIGRTFEGRKMRNLKASEVGDDLSSWVLFGHYTHLGRGLISFDYGDRSIGIRPGLEPDEASDVVNLLGHHLPRVSG